MNSINMDSKHKYTKDEFFYELENNFIDTLEDLPIAISCVIIFQLDKAVSESKGMISEKADTFTRGYFCSVIKRKYPRYYKAHYLELKDQPPLFFHLEFVDSDTYLDYMNAINETNEVKYNPVAS